MLAASRGSVDAVTLLLRYKADVSLLDLSRRSVFDFAVDRNEQEIYQLIVNAGGHTGKFYQSY